MEYDPLDLIPTDETMIFSRNYVYFFRHPIENNSKFEPKLSQLRSTTLKVQQIDVNSCYALVNFSIKKFKCVNKCQMVISSLIDVPGLFLHPVKEFHTITTTLYQHNDTNKPNSVIDHRVPILVIHFLVRHLDDTLSYFFVTETIDDNVIIDCSEVTTINIKVNCFDSINIPQSDVRKYDIQGFVVVDAENNLLLYAAKFDSSREKMIKLEWQSPLPNFKVKTLIPFLHREVIVFIGTDRKVYEMSRRRGLKNRQKLANRSIFKYFYSLYFEGNTDFMSLSSYHLRYDQENRKFYINCLGQLSQFELEIFKTRLIVKMISSSLGFLIEDDQGEIWYLLITEKGHDHSEGKLSVLLNVILNRINEPELETRLSLSLMPDTQRLIKSSYSTLG